MLVDVFFYRVFFFWSYSHTKFGKINDIKITTEKMFWYFVLNIFIFHLNNRLASFVLRLLSSDNFIMFHNKQTFNISRDVDVFQFIIIINFFFCELNLFLLFLHSVRSQNFQMTFTQHKIFSSTYHQMKKKK